MLETKTTVRTSAQTQQTLTCLLGNSFLLFDFSVLYGPIMKTYSKLGPRSRAEVHKHWDGTFSGSDKCRFHFQYNSRLRLKDKNTDSVITESFMSCKFNP